MSEVVLVDIDGTLADSDGIRSPYDESQDYASDARCIILQKCLARNCTDGALPLWGSRWGI